MRFGGVLRSCVSFLHVSKSRIPGFGLPAARRPEVGLSGLGIANISVPAFSLKSSMRAACAPLAFAAAIWAGSPTPIAMQDTAGMVFGEDAGAKRWAAYLEKSPAGSIHQAKLVFADASAVTSSMAPSGVTVGGTGKVAIAGKLGVTDPRPDEDRILRSDKRGRIARISRVAPPKAFTAGSIYQRTSALLLRPTVPAEVRMTFSKPDRSDVGIRVAQAFHMTKSSSEEVDLPVYLAEIMSQPNPMKAERLKSGKDKAAEKDGNGLTYATAYAAAGAGAITPFSALLKGDKDEKKEGQFIPPKLKGDHPWVQNLLPASVLSKKEQTCLANGIYFEARGEISKGQAAVAQVILNRVRSPYYPNTICGVVYQNKNWRNRCQFSFACDGIRDRIADRKRWNMAKEIGLAVTRGKIYLAEVGSATHYHATYVRPRWARKMNKTKKIGLHIFYRTKGGGWS